MVSYRTFPKEELHFRKLLIIHIQDEELDACDFHLILDESPT